jgi:predicted metal-dependent hydrolase
MEDPKLEVRNVRFADLAEKVPRHWHGGRRSVTAFFDNLSIFFPVGERFFIASVNAHRAHVQDARLTADIRAFAGQEGCHGREHERYNDLLRAQGFPVGEMEARVVRLLDRVKRVTPKRWQLAATCALEHFTALMAHLLLSNPGLLEGADPRMAALWRWHAAEENEHKAVCFDVYVAAGGTWAERAVVMAVVTAIFWAKVAEHQVRMMAVDGTVFSPREWARLVRFLFVKPGGMLGLARHYLAYFRPDFHPWDLDNRDLLAAWLREYETSPVYAKAA